MKELEQLHHLQRLKDILRYEGHEEVQDSTADHVYGCMILAEHFLPAYPDLNRERVYRLLIHHDLVEIEAGDTPVYDKEAVATKKEREQLAFAQLLDKVPDTIRDDMNSFYQEYEKKETPEAKFVNAIDKLEALIQMGRTSTNWAKHGWSEEYLRSIKDHHMKPFPVIWEFYDEMMKHLKEKGYFEE